MYLIPSFSKSRSIPAIPDFLPPYTFPLMKMARPSSQSPKIVSSFEEIYASTIPRIICSDVVTFFALKR